MKIYSIICAIAILILSGSTGSTVVLGCKNEARLYHDGHAHGSHSNPNLHRLYKCLKLIIDHNREIKKPLRTKSSGIELTMKHKIIDGSGSKIQTHMCAAAGIDGKCEPLAELIHRSFAPRIETRKMNLFVEELDKAIFYQLNNGDAWAPDVGKLNYGNGQWDSAEESIKNLIAQNQSNLWESSPEDNIAYWELHKFFSAQSFECSK